MILHNIKLNLDFLDTLKNPNVGVIFENKTIVNPKQATKDLYKLSTIITMVLCNQEKYNIDYYNTFLIYFLLIIKIFLSIS